MTEGDGRRSRLGAASRVRFLLAAILVALALPATALAWYSYYVDNAYFNAGGIGLSAFNSSLKHNIIDWNKVAGDPYQEVMQSTYCDSSYVCYPYSSDSTGYLLDSRTISYGRGKCHAATLNPNQVFIDYCYVDNFYS
jgi:hypothetical protein